jgi:hypothetical protein
MAGHLATVGPYLVNIDNTAPILTVTDKSSGAWVKSATVTATASDAYSQVNKATWKYSIDGGTTWLSGNTQNDTQSITLTTSGTYSVLFKVSDNVGNEATSTAQTVRVDAELPAIAVTNSATTEWASAATVSATATDGYSGINAATWQYSKDNGMTFSDKSTSGNTVTLSENKVDNNPYSVIFKVSDNAGNETKSAAVVVQIDTKVPVIDLQNIPTMWVNGSKIIKANARFVPSGIDKNSWECSLDDGSKTVVYTGEAYNSYPFSVTDTGIYQIGFRVMSNAGVYSELTSATIKMDNTLPAITIASSENLAGTVRSCTFTASATDGHSGINDNSWTYSIDGGTKQSGQDVTVNTNGPHVIEFSVYDNAGNFTSESIGVTIDVQGPTITLSKTPDQEWSQSATVGASSADSDLDANSWRYEILYTGELSPLTGTGNTVTLDKHGIATVQFFAADKLGNIGKSDSLPVKIDRLAPSFRTDYSQDGNKITAYADDSDSHVNSASYQYRLEGESLYRQGQTAVVPEGVNKKVFFVVSDTAGNTTNEVSFTVTVDISSPRLSFSPGGYVKDGKLLLTDFRADDAVTGLKKLEYRIDGVSDWTAIPKERDVYAGETVSLSLLPLAAGSHTLQVRAYDYSGNHTESGVYDFINDTVPPTVDGVSFKSDDRTLSPGDFISKNPVSVSILASDTYSDGGAEKKGVISSYRVGISDTECVLPASWVQQESSGFTVNNSSITLSNGINFIYVQALDGGGNASAYSIFELIRDVVAPGQPVIKSSTHRKAVKTTDAELSGKTAFAIWPQTTAEAGVAGYVWQLQICGDSSGSDVAIRPYDDMPFRTVSLSGELLLNFDLADNEAGEFYRLQVAAIGGNGVTGDFASYRFRVDSTPPQGLVISIAPQTDPDGWYNASDVFVTWNKPADKTGIAAYNLSVKNSSGVTVKTASLNATQLDIAVDDLLGGATGDRFILNVAAVDYAGNATECSRAFNVDRESPVFASEAQIIEGDTDSTRTITWGALGDGRSGVDYISLQITGLLDTDKSVRNIILPGTDTKYVINTLKKNAAYYVCVKGYDAAGNFAVTTASFATGGATLPETVKIAYEDIVNGYRITGTREISADGDRLKNGYIEIPDSMRITQTKNVDGVDVTSAISGFAFNDESTIFVDSRVTHAESADGVYSVSINGFVLSGTGFAFDRTNGLSLNGTRYVRTIYDSANIESDYTAELGASVLGFPASPVLQTTVAPVAGAPTAKTSGFSIASVGGIRLYGSKELLSGSPVGFTPQTIDLTCSDGSKKIPLNTVYLDAGSNNPVATVAAADIQLRMQKATFTVRKSGIRDKRYEVYEAVMRLPENYVVDDIAGNHDLVLKNFTIDDESGRVEEGPDFSSGSVKCYTADGQEITVGQITLGSDGTVYGSGFIGTGVYGSMPMTGLTLTNDGADMDKGCAVSGFETTVHNFVVKAIDASYSKNGILITNGTISVYDVARELHGLGLRIAERDSVYQTGTSPSIIDADSGYTSNILVNGITVEATGVYVSTVSLPLPEGNASSWTFSHVRMFSDGRYSVSSTDARTLTIGGYEFTATDTEFDGTKVVAHTGYVHAIAGYNAQKLELIELSFNASTLLSGGKQPVLVEAETLAEELAQRYLYSFKGWMYLYEEMHLAQDGLHGEGIIVRYNKNEQVDLCATFKDFLVKADGAIVSGKGSPDTDYNVIHYNDYWVDIPNSYMTLTDTGEYVLTCDSPEINLSTSRGDKITLGKLVIDSSVSIVESSLGSVAMNLDYANGYRIAVTGAELTATGVWIDGTIRPYSWTGGARTTSSRIHFLSDFTASFDDPEAEITYDYHGWTVHGKGVSFQENSVVVTKNIVTYCAQDIDLGPIEFYPDGSLSEKTLKYQQVPLAIVTNETRLIKTSVDDKGITGDIKIVLPEQFDGNEITYRDVRLNPDGSYYTEDAKSTYKLDLGAVVIDMGYVRLTSEGLKISDATIKIANLEQTEIKLRGLIIGNDGNVTLEGAATSPFTLWNMTFLVQNLSIKNGEIDIQGTFSLPESMPGSFSGRTIGIRSFKLGLDGIVKQFDARLEGEYVVPFLDSWALSTTGLGIGYANGSPYIAFDEAGLIFPAGFAVDTVSVSNVVFDPIKQSFNFDKIAAKTSISMKACGIQFNLNKLTIAQDMTVGFAGSATFEGDQLPGFIRGKSAVINSFEIKKDGGFGAVSIELTGLNGEIAPNLKALQLKEGTVSVEKNETGNLYLSVSGALEFTAMAPKFAQDISTTSGVALRIDQFTIDTSAPKITSLSARLSRETSTNVWSRDPAIINFDPVFLGNQLNDVYASFDWDVNANTGVIALSGGLVLPQSLPPGIAGTEIRLASFEIGIDGSLKSFGASYSIPKASLQALDLTDIKLQATYSSGVVEYDVGATMTLSAGSFPSGLGGLSTTARFVFTCEQLKSAAAECSVPDQLLMGSMQMHGVSLALDKQYGKDLLVTLKGGLSLPSSFPQGLAGMDVTIRNFTINAKGETQAVDIGASNINTTIFNALALKNGSVDFSNGTNNDFEVNIRGNLSFINAGIPEGLRKTSFDIDELRISTSTGLKKFTAGMYSSMNFTLLNGLDFNVSRLTFSERGFAVSASVKVDFSSVTLGNSVFTLKNLAMDWNGNILDIQGGIQQTSVTIAGFTGSISELYVQNSPGQGYMVAMKECRITMPDNFGSLGGKSVALKNATFNPQNGNFNGDIETPQMQSEFAGFMVILNNPTINLYQCKIAFSSVWLKMPEFMGSAQVALNKVEVSASNGFKVGGGGFTLPDFKVGELGFRNVGAEFVLDGSTYFISGHGGIMLPGAGIIDAALSFTNVSETYPIGLKHAYFSYEAYMGGIPLGTTSLYLSGIRGGLAYGYPNEVPEKYRAVFGDNGTRVQLGLTIKDQTGGKAVRMDADTWIDITKIAWVFNGDATILSGTLNIKANTAAIITHNAFATGMSVRIVFVKGAIEIYIFDLNGALKFSGQGYVSFGMPQAYLYDGIFVDVPSSDIWLGSIGSMFGDFTNGKQGFMGYVEINIGSFNLGRVGAFVGSGGLDINISNYQILKPSGISLSMRRSSGAGVVMALDSQIHSTKNVQKYTVVVPKSGKVDSAANAKRSSVAPTRSLSATTAGSGYTADGPGKVIFIVGYQEGDPGFTVVSPSGLVYKPGDAKVETSYFENGLLIAVNAPETGTWSISMENMDEGTYEIAVLGVESVPSVTIKEPATGILKATDTVHVSGTVDTAFAQVHVFAASEASLPGFDLGALTADANGNYAGDLSTANLVDGEYVLLARAVTKNGFYSPAATATGKYRVDRSGIALSAPGKIRIAETNAGTVKLVWENANASRTAGYYLTSRNVTAGTESKDNIGNISTITINGYETGTELEFAVSAYDSSGVESGLSDVARIVIGAEKPVFNRPAVSSDVIDAITSPGQTVAVTVPVTVENRHDTGDSFSYILAKQKSGDNDSHIQVLPAQALPAKDSGNEQTLYVYADELCPAGSYDFPCVILNEGNAALRDDFTLRVTVSNPQPAIVRIEPQSLNGLTENIVSVFGTGFIAGTRYYFDGTEVSVAGSDADNSSLRTLKIPVTASRGTKKLVITGPDGKTVTGSIDVHVPDWDAIVYTSIVGVHSGEKAVYPIKIKGLDDFAGKASLSVKSTEPGFIVSLPDLVAGETGEITVEVPSSCAAGEYATVISGGTGKLISLVTRVTAEAIAPVISSVTPGTGYAGSLVTIYGYGFGSSGTLLLNGTSLATKSWTSTAVSFVVPDSAPIGSGTLSVQTDGGTSNLVSFTVRSCGFTLHSAADTITLAAGESAGEEIILNGYAEKVSFTVNAAPDAPFDISLSKYEAVPNAVITLIATPRANATNGDWKVTVTGTGGNYSSSLVLTVHIGDSFCITTDKLPDGTCSVPYRKELACANVTGAVYWKVSGGALPLGLSLSSGGVISGEPERAGTKTVKITAYTDAGKTVSADYTMRIQDDIWAQGAKNGGRVRSVASDAPSTDRVLWNATAEGNVAGIYAQSDRTILVSVDSVTALDQNGRMFWIDRTAYAKSLIQDNLFIGLTAQKKLITRSLNTGIASWNRANVESMISDGTTIVTKESDGYYVINATTGTVTEKRSACYGNADGVIWNNGAAWEVSGDSLTGIYGTASHWVSATKIFDAACDANGFVVLTADAIVVLDPDLKEIGRINRLSDKDTKVGIDKAGICVQDASSLTEYDRSTLEYRWSVKAGKTFALASEKAILTDSGSLRVINRYSGSEIWHADGSYTALALYGQKIYVARGKNVTAYNGDPNATAPDTRIVYAPAGADGTNGWYKTLPTLSVLSRDAETYVAGISYRQDNGNWETYADPLPVAEGYTSTEAYGTDSKGYRGVTVASDVKVDITAPRSSAVVSAILPESGWYNGDVSVSIEASDALSGIARVRTGDTTYAGTITYKEEGVHTLVWNAVDNAGNEEPSKTLVIKIDRSAPYAAASVRYDDGISLVTIDAGDTGSGLDYAEYRIDGGEATRYAKPIPILKAGRHTVTYRATDKSGWSCEWKTVYAYVSRNSRMTPILGLAEVNGDERNEICPLLEGMPLYEFEFHGRPRSFDFRGKFGPRYERHWAHNLIGRLPDYARGGEYIVWKERDIELDSSKTASFYVKQDAVVYMFAEKGAAIPSGWTFIESGIRINDDWYPAGCDAYMRWASAGERVTITEKGIDAPLPLIVAQGIDVLTTKIQLSVIDEGFVNVWFDFTGWLGSYMFPIPDVRKDSTFYGGSTLRLTARVTPESSMRKLPLKDVWYAEVAGTRRQLEGDAWELPSVSEKTAATLYAEIVTPDGKVVSSAQRSFTIVPQPKRPVYPADQRGGQK